ncbi:MAG: glycosyltransferase family 2 protein [Bacteroidia bacterium]
MPKVSVFMPVYNAGVYLKEAIESILNQSFTDFEFVIVNDGSTDNSREVVLSYQDNRIKLIDNPQNLGLIASLNVGLEVCKGEYIVRMDQDDISLPDRILKQVRFMDDNPEFGLIGSWFEDFGDQIQTRTVKYSSNDVQIRIRHLYQTHISHPTAVMRSSVVKQNQIRFDPEFVHGEDYNCWVTFSEFCKLSNYPEVLVRKRDHPTNITNKYAEVMNATCNRVKRRQFEKMGVPISVEEADLYSRFANPEWNFNVEEMNALAALINRLNNAQTENISIPGNLFREYIALKWFHLCYHNLAIRPKSAKFWRSAEIHSYYKPGWLQLQRMNLRNTGLPV